MRACVGAWVGGWVGVGVGGCGGVAPPLISFSHFLHASGLEPQGCLQQLVREYVEVTVLRCKVYMKYFIYELHL